jgi:hypothetical protein
MTEVTAALIARALTFVISGDSGTQTLGRSDGQSRCVRFVHRRWRIFTVSILLPMKRGPTIGFP